jgi:hypothetical protein
MGVIMRVQNGRALWHSLVLAKAAALSIAGSVGVNAADLAYPPPLAAPPPEYGQLAPPPPQALIIPAPAAPPPYSGAGVLPQLAAPRYGVAPPAAVTVVPRACPQIGPCGPCGSQAPCPPYAEGYPSPYEPPVARVYPNPISSSALEQRTYEEGPYAPRPYPGPAAPCALDRERYWR